jgi:hypothetical protein
VWFFQKPRSARTPVLRGFFVLQKKINLSPASGVLSSTGELFPKRLFVGISLV